MNERILSLQVDEAIALGHQTVDLMSAQKVPPTAQNYEVWLAYRTGALSELKREIDARISRREPFSAEANEQLYERYFSNARFTAQMMATGERIAQELNGVVAALQSAGDHTQSYGRELELTASRLAQSIDADSLRAVITKMAAVTFEMTKVNKDLTADLKRSSSELESMRKTIREIKVEALTDGLTGLANRKLFDQTLSSRLREARQSGGELTLALIDIDHFKRFNDTWGHQTGDQIIRFVAATLQRLAPPDALAARYGGEEFALVLPARSAQATLSIAENIRKAVESKSLVRKSTGEDLGRITVSIGVASARAHDDESTLIDRADACLYGSKHNGRNRVTVESDRSALDAA